MHTYKVGDILSSSWGYDQTNVTFYQVTRVTKASVELGTLRSQSTPEQGFMTAYKTPLPGEFTSDKRFMRRIGDGTGIRISGNYEYAYPWDGKPERYSWYA